MKKVLNVLLFAFLCLSGLFSASSKDRVIPTITAETSINSNGVVIKFDKSIIPEHTASINLRRISTKYPNTNSDNITNYYVSTSNLRTNKIEDFFTTPNEEYTYIITFLDTYSNIILQSEPYTIKALSGIGNGLKNNSCLRFDENTKKSTIIPSPYIDFISLNIPVSNVEYNLTYKCNENNYIISGKINNKGIIKWNFDLGKVQNKQLQLQNYSLKLRIKDNDYNLIVYLDELKEYLDTESFKEIVPQDIKQSLSLQNTNEGIVIELPKFQNSERAVQITRTNLSNNTTVIASIENINTLRFNTITDIFVNSGDKYEYKLSAGIYLWEFSYESIPTLIPTNDGIALGGIGEPTLGVIPKASFDSDTGIMTFETLPDLPQKIKDYLTGPNDSYAFYIWYKNRFDGTDLITEIKEEIDLNTYHDDYVFNRNLNFKRIDIKIIKDGVTYKFSVPSTVINTDSSCPNMPDMIKIVR